MEKEERKFLALDFLLDYSKGTLWRVKDHIWDKAIKGFVWKRKEHPGLSIATSHAGFLCDTIPMLIGTTKNPGRSVCVRNFYADSESKNRITYFGVLRPGLIRFNEFGTSKSVIMNSAKTRLDESEMEDLDKRLKIEGVENA